LGRRVKSEKYLRELRNMGCLLCGTVPCGEVHHLLRVPDTRGMGLRSADKWAIPCCRRCHHDLHMDGNEKVFLAMRGVDAVAWATDSWEKFNE
jgi:hypothetical protein